MSREIRELPVVRAGEGRYGDFTSAEQAFLAVETLSIVLGDSQAIGSALDAWFETLSNEHAFDPDRYASTARRVESDLR